MNADRKFEKLKNEMLERFYRIYPEMASYIGLHDPYDNQLSKGDLTLYSDIEKLLEEFENRMKETIDFDELSELKKLEWEYIERALPLHRFFVHEQRQSELNPDAFFPLGYTFFMMIARNYAPFEVRMKAMASRIEQIPQYLKEFRTRFAETRPVKFWLEIALETAQQMTMFFQFLSHLSKGQISVEAQERLDNCVSALDQPLKEHMKWLQELQSKTTDNWALGKDRFEKLLQLRGFEMTSEEILQYGVEALKTLKAERAQIAAQIDPQSSVEEVMTTISLDRPETFEEVLTEAREAMQEAKQFIIENDIVSIYKEDELIVEETPAYLATLIPLAAMIPGSLYDTPPIGVFLMTRPEDMNKPGLDYLSHEGIRGTAVHEAFPGHFLQTSASSRETLIPLFSALITFLGSETWEGWAMYCEEMMLEKGFLKGAKAKMIQLNAAIFRAVRIIVDVRMSRGEMTIEDAVNMGMKETGVSKEAAIAEVRRYTIMPGQPLSYLIGKHLILQLRDEIKEKMGSKFSDRFFHDTITAYGEFPISMIKAFFTRQISKLES